MAKRGRKNQLGIYFGPVEEEAVTRYLASDDQRERSVIYNEFLRKPLDKMIESIIRRYGLYRKMVSFEDLHSDTLSFLITKAHKFEDGRGKKAYSYYGTICKNYILGLLIKDEKLTRQITSYDDIYEIVEARPDLCYEIDEPKFDISSLIDDIILSVKKELDINEVKLRNYMTDNERKVGEELINILENWETVINFKGGNKYNKNSILSCLREGTHLNTKDIRNAMRKYKRMYSFIIENHINEGS